MTTYASITSIHNSIWELYYRFYGADMEKWPTLENRLRYFNEEAAELTYAVGAFDARPTQENIEAVQRELADVIYTAIGLLTPMIDPFTLQRLLGDIVESNDRKTLDTHEVRDNKIRRRKDE